MFVGKFIGAFALLIVGWRVGVWLSFPSGNEETPPTCRIALPSGEKARALATEQKRNVHPCAWL
jgi:hypothetical protein